MNAARTPSLRRAVPWAVPLVAALALAAPFWPGAPHGLWFERDRVLEGEWWRLWTAHVVHLGASHLFWNLAVFLPAGLWAERIAPRRTRWFLLLAPPAIGLVLLALAPGLQGYVGLSGVAAGMLAWLAFLKLRAADSDRGFWWGALALLGLKIVAESMAGRPIFASFPLGNEVPVPLAHLAGIACAVLAGAQRPRQRGVPKLKTDAPLGA